MNYQRLLSKFYNAPEQSSGEINNFPDPASNILAKNDILEEFTFRNNDESETTFPEIPSPELVDQSQESISITTEPLNPEDIRWFYKAADEKSWSEFNGYDSLLIENKYREIKLDTKYEENEDDIVVIDAVITGESGSLENVHNRISLKDKSNKSSSKKTNNENKVGENSKSNNHKDKTDEFDDELTAIENKITVRGGMYEVDLSQMQCESIYWPGEKYIITRGLYFFDGTWQPLEEKYGEKLEQIHLELFGKKNEENTEKPPTQPGTAVHAHHFVDFHIEWLSVSEIYLHWGGTPRQLVRSVTQKLGFYQSTGYRLRRGYRKKASISEQPPKIEHVIFIIHGIGQKMDSERIIRNTNSLRANCEWLRTQYYNMTDGESKGRAELFPAKWRAGDRGHAAKLLAAAAPLGAPALRRAINDAAMDVMYYTSPVYGKQVLDDLTNELNRLYTIFMARNPNYTGHFSAVAHSLGSVILYDIISGYEMGCEKCEKINDAPEENNSRLLFKMEQVFFLGSPLGVFLALRQSQCKSRYTLPTTDTRFYNIFHLSDPVAYRLEPLFGCWLAKHPPLVIPHYSSLLTAMSNPNNQPVSGGWKIWSLVKHPWQRSESGTPILNAQSNIDNGEQSHKSKSCENSPKKMPSTHVAENLADTKKGSPKKVSFSATSGINIESFDPYETENSFDDFQNFKEKEYEEEFYGETSNELRKPQDVLPYRIDYTFKDSFITHNYLSAITSHTAYWTNYDVAMFILSHLRPETNDIESENASQLL